MLGAGVSAAVALLFWPRRLEPLVVRLMAEVSAAAGALLAGTAAQVTAPTGSSWTADRRSRPRPGRAPRSSSCSTSTGADRSSPSRAWPASAWRCTPGPRPTRSCGCPSSCRARRAGAPTPTLVAFADQLADAATLVQADLGPGAGHRRPAARTAPRGVDPRPPRSAAIAAAHGDAPVVVRAVLARDWIVGVAQMVDHRP